MFLKCLPHLRLLLRNVTGSISQHEAVGRKVQETLARHPASDFTGSSLPDQHLDLGVGNLSQLRNKHLLKVCHLQCSPVPDLELSLPVDEDK